jgi:hypothetical protein
MLKLTYTENGFCLELLHQNMEKWLKNRLWVSVRAATSFYVEPSSASFLLPANLEGLNHLEKLQYENGEVMAIALADQEFVEINLYGNWIVGDPNSEEGIFVATLTQKAEFFLFNLWQEAQNTPIEL